MAIGTILGVPAHVMLALSLVTRIREMLPSILFVIYYQIIEGRHLMEGGAAKAE